MALKIAWHWNKSLPSVCLTHQSLGSPSFVTNITIPFPCKQNKYMFAFCPSDRINCGDNHFNFTANSSSSSSRAVFSLSSLSEKWRQSVSRMVMEGSSIYSMRIVWDPSPVLSAMASWLKAAEGLGSYSFSNSALSSFLFYSILLLILAFKN